MITARRALLLIALAALAGCAQPRKRPLVHEMKGEGGVAWLARDQAAALRGEGWSDYWKRWGRRLEQSPPNHLPFIEQPNESFEKINRAMGD